MKSEREKVVVGGEMDIVWQTPANPPMRHDYIFRNGRRHVRPYYFEFTSHVKDRWIGKTIVDLFTLEFKGRNHDYYVSAVECGRIQVDGKMVPVSHILRSSQKISHFVHRHEPPVMALDISILLQEPDVLTICKPASIPVHPCGQYRKNTVVGILEAEHNLAPLFPIHRLDRLVSGLLILARSTSKADFFRQQIEAGLIQKQYVARVIGVFPEGEQVVNANIHHNAREKRSTTEVDDSCGKTPLKSKTACTKFTRISTDGRQSIVLCKPITGRTHQIRVHLQYTGHPIANDMLYLSNRVKDRSVTDTTADRSETCVHFPTRGPREGFSNRCQGDSSEGFSIDPMCTNCPNLIPKGYEAHEEGLWLHCVCYTGTDWSYECPYPEWATI